MRDIALHTSNIIYKDLYVTEADNSTTHNFLSLKKVGEHLNPVPHLRHCVPFYQPVGSSPLQTSHLIKKGNEKGEPPIGRMSRLSNPTLGNPVTRS